MAEQREPNPTAADAVTTNVETFRDDVLARLTLPPQDDGFPLSVLVACSAKSADKAFLSWFPTSTVTMPGRTDGFGQALCMSRELLSLLIRLDNDFGLNLPGLSAVLEQHPLFSPAPALPQVTKRKDGTRHVRDMVTDGGKGGGNVS